MKSLTAKITATVVVLVIVIALINTGLVYYFSTIVRSETQDFASDVNAIIEQKDAFIGEVVDEEVKAGLARLAAEHEAATTEARADSVGERRFIAGKHAGISASATTMIRAAMMSGEATTAEDIMYTLSENPDILSIDVWRPTGIAAFSDNSTIETVNATLGTTYFEARSSENPVPIPDDRRPGLETALAADDGEAVLPGEVEDDQGALQPVLFSFAVLDNDPECQGCHGRTDEPRGVLEVAVSRAGLVALEERAAERLEALEAEQAQEMAALTDVTEAQRQEVKETSARYGERLDARVQELSQTQLQSTTVQAIVNPLAALVVLGLIVFLLSRLLSRPLRAMTGAMERLAHDDLEVEIPGRSRTDEIGDVADAMQVFKENGYKLREMAAEQEAMHRRNARKVKAEMFGLTHALDEEVRSAIALVQTQADAMHDAAREMAKSVGQTENRSEAAAGASRAAAQSVDAVAAAAEEMAGSVAEISRQVSASTTTAHRAVQQAETTNERIQGLARAANEIGEVVGLINDIAKQTNLLALNATIEAARAGEAGKGFAVVANEVKTLANQTAKATEEIATQIGAMQAATKEAVDAIQEIANVIGEMNEITTAVSAAVEEQTAATQEISSNAQQASHNTQESAQNIGEVSEASTVTGGHARSVEQAAQDVQKRVDEMQAALEHLVRGGTEEDRFANDLHAVKLSVTVDTGDGRAQICQLRALARSGVGALDRVLDQPRGHAFTITVPGLGALPGSIVAKTAKTTHIRLELEEGDAAAAALEKVVARAGRLAA
ncbi:methyl-accepting chemotaxis protein [Roseospira goensis]|uniref:Methyl-accepting chemotaxis protein n=1 Tax=Roseospira goensis TaxID=391922 RepID=A0A7W6WJS7_9PROT|nr:methyl-accepting chemotaxis protein [Roseospira goensis]MBB4284969.1 methyl-accepting chemotaxis protein [Roseospira goensis]